MIDLGKINLIIITGLAIAAIIIDCNNPTTVIWVRCIYYGIQMANLFAIFLIHLDISSKNENQKFQFTQITSTMGALGEDEVRVISSSIKDYDLKQNAVLLRSSLIMLIILSAVHFLFGWTKILIVQLYLPVKILLVHPLVRVHLLQNEAKGELTRPWNMYSKIPGSTLGTIVKERPVTPKDLKNQRKEANKELTPEEKAKKMKKRR